MANVFTRRVLLVKSASTPIVSRSLHVFLARFGIVPVRVCVNLDLI
jgi:hypothetical protein